MKRGIWERNEGTMGMRGIRVEMRGIGGNAGTVVGMRRIEDGNEGNHGENLCIGVELRN